MDDGAPRDPELDEPVPPTLRQLSKHWLEMVRTNNPVITAIDLSYGKVYWNKKQEEEGDADRKAAFEKSLWDEEGSEELPKGPYRRLQDLFLALDRNNKVKTLDLSWNYIKDSGAYFIGHWLAHNKTSAIQTVKLWGCGIGPHGAVALAQALVYRKNLKIELWGNGIGPVGTKALADAKRTTNPNFKFDLKGLQGLPETFEDPEKADGDVPKPLNFAEDTDPNTTPASRDPVAEGAGFGWGSSMYDKKLSHQSMGDLQNWFQNTTTNAPVKSLVKKKKK